MKDAQLTIAPTQNNIQRKVFLKIGRPGYRVTKVRDPETRAEGMMVQVHLPQIKLGVQPRRRFMSAWEQKREPPNRAYQYLIVSFSADLRCAESCDLCIFRLLLSHMKQLLSAFQRARSRKRTMMIVVGTGHTGIQIPSNTVFSSCSGIPYDLSIVVASSKRCNTIVFLYVHVLMWNLELLVWRLPNHIPSRFFALPVCYLWNASFL